MADKLFYIINPVKTPSFRIFCFPFAGGNINTYFSWKDKFADDVELVLIQPPGRGSRIMEKPHDSMQSYINELLERTNYFTHVPYILFGHSLGARVAYELACQLISNDCPAPHSLVVSGSRAPHINNASATTFDLPDDEFIELIIKLNGTPTEVAQNKEMMSLVLPLLRADFKIAETYVAKKLVMPLPVVVFSGNNDSSINIDAVEAWRELSEFDVQIDVLPGDHFFINEHTDTITKRITVLTQNSPMHFPKDS